MSATVTVTAEDDSEDDDGESITIGFGTLPTGVTAGSRDTTTVSLADDDGPAVTAVTVQFGAASYTATEGGTAATVEVTLSADPQRTVTIPLSVTAGGGAVEADYDVSVDAVTFDAGETSATFTVTANDDMVDDDDESITIAFGTLPTGVTATSPDTTTVSLADNDDPAVTVQFGAASYTATEGGTAATVEVTLSADPERTVDVPLEVTTAGGASSADYTLSQTSVTFNSGDTTATFTVTAEDDSEDDDGESITIGFGTLPTGVTAGSRDTTTVSLVDDDVAAVTAVTVQFSAASYTATEGGTAATVEVTLSADPERTVTVPLTVTAVGGAVEADYDVSVDAVTFDAGETSATFTVTANDDMVDDDDESHHDRVRHAAHRGDRDQPRHHHGEPDRQRRPSRHGAVQLDVVHGDRGRHDGDRRGDAIGGSRAHSGRAAGSDNSGRGVVDRLHAVRHVADVHQRADDRDVHGDRGGRQ